jgi:hypothetical protein
MPTKTVKETKPMEKQNGFTPEPRLTPEDICGKVDCFECPFFLRLDICGYEVASELYFREGVAS